MAQYSPISFTKMSGTGNDFIIIDHRTPCIAEEEQSAFAAKVCRRMFSVGGDGLILIEDSVDADFSWRFYNGDGSVAEMCGNGARCAARFAYLNGIAGKKMSFETIAGIIEAEIMDDESVSLLMTDPFDFNGALEVELAGKERMISFVNTGVPHAVCFVDPAEDVEVKKWGRTIRFHDHFQPAGTNANFIQPLGENHISVRTYERGVEDETMACGTGAVAGALWAAITGIAVSPVAVTTSGGDRLTISFDLLDGPAAVNVHLQGPALVIYQGELGREALS
ncbi:MAG: diaminopimelate epimerase [Thermodesulfobacteriota bacterium]